MVLRTWAFWALSWKKPRTLGTPCEPPPCSLAWSSTSCQSRNVTCPPRLDGICFVSSVQGLAIDAQNFGCLLFSIASLGQDKLDVFLLHLMQGQALRKKI